MPHDVSRLVGYTDKTADYIQTNIDGCLLAYLLTYLRINTKLYDDWIHPWIGLDRVIVIVILSSYGDSKSNQMVELVK